MESRETAAWILAGVLLLASGITLTTRPADSGKPAAQEDMGKLSAENQRLRATVVQLRGEGLSLRAELDRLLGHARHSTAAAPAVAPDAAVGAQPPVAELAQQIHGISSEINALSAAMLEGKPNTMKDLFARISQLQAMGPEALPAIKEGFSEATDPGARRILASVLALKGGPAEEQFLLSAAERETDPEMKQALLANAGALGGEGRAQAAAQMLSSASSPDAAMRANAIRGFADFSDSAAASTVENALKSDRSESVRLAALDALMSDPTRRDQALQTASRDPSPRIRGIAECRERLADLEAAASE